MTGARMTTIFLFAIAATLGALAWLIYDLGLTAGRDEVRLAWEQQKVADGEANARASKQAREVEAGLMRHIDEIRRQHEKDITAIDLRHAAALERVLQRAKRPDNYVPAPAEATGTQPAASCGGDRLFREDAEVLVGLATAADTVRASLTECRAQYDAAASALFGEKQIPE